VTTNPDYEALADIVRRRRTNMQVDPSQVVPPAVIDELCQLATWAPNHKRTWPWRFASFTGDGRAQLGEAFVADMIARDFGDEGKRQKTRTKYTRTPNVVVVGCGSDAKPTIHAENRDTVAAAIHTLLLGATALGIASFWSTPPLIDSASALELCGFEPSDRIIGVIYLGYPAASAETPVRPAARVNHIA